MISCTVVSLENPSWMTFKGFLAMLKNINLVSSPISPGSYWIMLSERLRETNNFKSLICAGMILI